MESIKATMLSVRYRSPERNWLVAQMRNDNTKEKFIATGDIPYSETEEPVQLYGDWIEDAKYGKQLKVTTSHRVLPATVEGIRGYLASSEDIKGIGPKRAAALAEHFGPSLINILDKNPKRLSECLGISVDLAARIATGWKQDSAIRQLSMHLAQHGISPRWAARILKQWDADTAIRKINENPYSLTCIDGIGFTTADELSAALGIQKNDPRRVQSAVTYVIQQAIQVGSVFLHEGQVIDEVTRVVSPRTKSDETLAKANKLAAEGLAKAILDKQVVVEEITDGIITMKLIYLPHMYRAEKKLAERIAEHSSNKINDIKNIDSHIKESQQNQHVDYSTKQIEAIRGAFSNNISIITGGPGTGKTTCVRAICQIAEKMGRHAVLCAPTGRASKRLTEVTERSASTIHRLLQWRDDSPQRNRNNPIEADLLIIDESSMLDLELADKLLEAIPDGCRVVFIGDIDQLPAVGAGSTLRDIIGSKTINVTQLDSIFRQAESSLIVRNAHRIKAGELPRFPEAKGEKENCYVMWMPPAAKDTEGGRDDAEWLKAKLSKIVSQSIGNTFKDDPKPFNPIRDIQVLVPMKKHTIGAHELNKTLQNALNPNGEVYHAGNKAFRRGDRVMQTRNNYAEGMEVYNGDIGFIVGCEAEDKVLKIDFDGRIVDYQYSDTEDLQLAYAQTIHKAQGSEYPVVIVVMGFQHWPMLERNLLYTAATRAKKMCLFMASKGAIERAVKNNPVKARNTYLSQRLRALHKESESA